MYIYLKKVIKISMEIRYQTVTGKYQRELKTEIMFFIASSKALGEELFILKIKPAFLDERDARRTDSVSRILKDLKRRGIIQFFAVSSDFGSPLTEIEYLKNKYPDITEIKSDESFFVVKV